MAHMIETMAYAGETPWHGLGVRVSNDLSPEEMMVKAGLDWGISKVEVFYKWNGMDRKVDIKDIGGILMRNTDGAALGFGGPEFIPSQNLDCFKFFDKFVKTAGMEMHTAGAIRQGKEIWVLAKIKKGFKLPGGDEIEGYLLLHNPHVWGKSLTIKFTPIRVVCNNTVTFALSSRSTGNRNDFRMPHIQAFDLEVAKAAENALGLCEQQMTNFQEASAFMASKRYDEISVRKYLVKLIQPDLRSKTDAPLVAGSLDATIERTLHEVTVGANPLIAAIAQTPGELDYGKINFYDKPVSNQLRLAYGALDQSPGSELESAKGTWWGAFNAVTFVMDHKVGRTRDTALQSAWFGDRATVKAKAFDMAVAAARNA